MCARSFLCEEDKIKQRTSSKKKLCEIGEEAIWESYPLYKGNNPMFLLRQDFSLKYDRLAFLKRLP